MAASHEQALQQHGFIPLDKESVGIVDILLDSRLPQVSPCPINWDIYFNHSLKQAWLSNRIRPTLTQDQCFLKGLKQYPQNERIKILSQVLCEIAREVLGLGVANKITETDDLFSMGLDSLMALEIRHRIQDKLQCERLSLSIEYFIHQPRIDKLANMVADELQRIFDSATEKQGDEIVPLKEVVLSDFQYLFWVYHKFGYSANVGMQIQIHGKLNKDTVLRAFQFVVNQNNAFWLDFNAEAPIQTLNKQGQLTLVYKDVSLSTEAHYCLNQEFRDNIMRLIPLNQQPLLRIFLYRINNNLHELHIVIPNIIVDDASNDIVFNQFKSTYEALALGKNGIPVPERNLFLNYLQHHNEQYEKDLDHKVQFWKEYNKDFKRLFLGSVYHLPDAAVHQAQHLFHYKVAPQVMEQFIGWHQQKNINVSSGLIAVCQIAFHNISDQNKIPITLLHSGREGSDYKAVVGVFAEYKRINLTFQEGDSFLDCILSIDEQLLTTAPYQKCALAIKNDGLKDSRLSLIQRMTLALNQLFVTKYFKKYKISATLIGYSLDLLSQIESYKKRVLMKVKMNQLLDLALPLQPPDGMHVLISITPGFFRKESSNLNFADLEYTFPNHFACLDRPIGNQTLWIYFTKNQQGEYLLSINGPLTTSCKDRIAADISNIISGISHLTPNKVKSTPCEEGLPLVGDD